MGRIKSRIKNSSENNHISIDGQEYPVNKLLDDSYSKKRIQELLNDTNPIQVIMDSNQQMRFAVINELEKILSYKVPIILFDRTYNPYVVSTPERDALQMLSCDISPVVHMCAKEAFNRIKERELKQTVTLLLKQYGMYELAISLGMDLRHSLLKKLVRQEIIGLPTDKEIKHIFSSKENREWNREVAK